MAPIIGFILGALWGGTIARRRKGNWMDVAQYALVHGIILGLAATLISVLALRLGWV